MNGKDVCEVLKSKGVTNLHHANSVTTSCSFLQIEGLASRGYVEDNKFPQTPQYTDAKDKEFGIWYDIFTDGVDIHHRGRIRNDYGPVLFLLPVDILLHLPSGTSVMVARDNPIRWGKTDKDSDRYFLTQQDLYEHYTYGDFCQHIIIRTPEKSFLPFVHFPVILTLDDPQLPLSNGADAYKTAVCKLKNAARAGDVTVQIGKRSCQYECGCLLGRDRHTGYQQIDLDSLF